MASSAVRKAWDSRVGASLAETWRDYVLRAVQSPQHAEALKSASLEGRLRDWTMALTGAVVAACNGIDWEVAAKGHRLQFLPEQREEFLAIDMMAFERSGSAWSFPVAVIELENSRRPERIAYSLWKVLNIRARLRVVFCYRTTAEQGADLVRDVGGSVVGSLPVAERTSLSGETLIVVGYRNQAGTFPYGFFKWWRLNTNTGRFEQF